MMSKSVARRSRLIRLSVIILLCASLSGCVGTLVGAVVDTTIEVAKIPFKVGGAVVDVVTGDEDDEPEPEKQQADDGK